MAVSVEMLPALVPQRVFMYLPLATVFGRVVHVNRQWCRTAGTAIVISQLAFAKEERMLAITRTFRIRFGRILVAPSGDLWELVRGDRFQH